MPAHQPRLYDFDTEKLKKKQLSFFLSYEYFTMRKCHTNEIPECHSLNEIRTNPFNDVIEFSMLYACLRQKKKICSIVVITTQLLIKYNIRTSYWEIDFFTAFNLHIIYCVMCSETYKKCDGIHVMIQSNRFIYLNHVICMCATFLIEEKVFAFRKASIWLNSLSHLAFQISYRSNQWITLALLSSAFVDLQ